MGLVPPMSIKKSLAEAEGDVQSAEKWDEWAKSGFWISLGVAIVSSLSWEDDDLIDLIPGDFFFLAFVISIPTALGCLGVLWMNTTTPSLLSLTLLTLYCGGASPRPDRPGAAGSSRSVVGAQVFTIISCKSYKFKKRMAFI